MSRFMIIDPTSTEFNRGSFCYAPYLLYNFLREMDHQVVLVETFKTEDFDKLDCSWPDYIILTLWSYPQIEIVKLLDYFLPDNVYCAGYNPLINHHGLPSIEELFGFDPISDRGSLQIAIEAYPKYYPYFEKLLLSDCDMHLQSKEKGEKVYPLFTTYGCPNGCAFCPSTVNCNHSRTILSSYDTIELLKRCHNSGVRYIHFTDEDFFFSPLRAYHILEGIKELDFHLIALGSSKTVLKFVERYGTDIIKESGMELIEVGFETADEGVSEQMGSAKVIGNCEKLASIQQETGIDIFWLTQTFFPGETIHSLNLTGDFLRQYGYNMDQVVGRLRTNGTKGGLGQFFQPYHGTPIFSKLKREGLFLTSRPIRLMPSYLPNSFLDDPITNIDYSQLEEVYPWLKLYNAPNLQLREGTVPRYYITGHATRNQARIAISLALLARFRVIT